MSSRPSLEPARQLRTVRNLAVIRWVAIAWAVVQVATYYLPYPPGVLIVAILAVGVLLTGNAGIWLAYPRARTASAIRRLAVASVLVDGVAIMTLVYAYTFDTGTAIWAVLYIVPLGAAALFQLRGALWTMAAVTVLYALREVYGHVAFGNPLLVVSISFRMGVGFIISAFAGSMASGLVSRLGELRMLNRITQTVADERNLHQALDAVSTEMASMFDVRTAAIALLDREARTVSVMADSGAAGTDVPPLRGRCFHLGDSPFLEQLVRSPAASVLSDFDDRGAGEEIHRSMHERRARRMLVVPLQVRSEVIGALLLETDRPDRSFSAAEISLAETVAGQIAGAIANARLFDEMVEYVEQVGQVTDAAGAVETGTFSAASLDGVGHRADALGQLARVFQRMAQEIAARELRLRQEVHQLRIEIDEARTARRVEEITESEYFQQIQKKAQQLRLDRQA